MRAQGVLVVIDGVGVLLRGPSGVGKSSAALGLMDRGHRLVTDDLVEIIRGADGKPVGRAVEANVRIELRGAGVFPVRSLFPDGTLEESGIDLVMDLEDYAPKRDAGRTEPEMVVADVAGYDVPAVRLPVTSGSNTALTAELLVRALFGTKARKNEEAGGAGNGAFRIG